MWLTSGFCTAVINCLDDLGNDVVIIGRGKLVQHHPANIRYRAIIQSQLHAYSNAETKGLKSSILRRILNDVRNNSANNLGFVKRDTATGRWCVVHDDSARINIAQAFRDGLHSEYKSSKKHKQQKRNEELGISSPITVPQMDSQLQQNIFSALSRFETKIEEPVTGLKRARLMEATNSNPTTSSLNDKPSDQTLGRLGGNMDRLRHFLNGTHEICNNPLVGSLEWTQSIPRIKRKLSSDSIDTFTRLCDRVENSSALPPRDPFEPAPINTHQQKENSQENLIAETRAVAGAAPYPNFAMSVMVDKTNPTIGSLPQPAFAAKTTAIATVAADHFESRVIIDPIPSSCRTEIIASHSLSSLALSDNDSTIGMNSLSSISDNMDKEHGDMELQDAFDIFGKYKAQDIEAILMAS